jgi:7-cyano-7-deazaguanine synthase in queuosine biosynthesis
MALLDKEGRMNMVKALIKNSQNILKDTSVTQGLYTAAVMLDESYDSIKKSRNSKGNNLRIEHLGLELHSINPLSWPDAIWRAYCRRHPGVYEYPLGEIMERTLKKTVCEIICKTPIYPYDKVDPVAGDRDNHTRENLTEFMTASNKEKAQLIFTTYFFFEVCMDTLRRPLNGDKKDWAYRYHFSREGKMVSWAAEKRLRRILTYLCVRMARQFKDCLSDAVRLALDNPERARLRIRKGFRELFGLKMESPAVKEDAMLPLVNIVVGNDLDDVAELVMGNHDLSYYKKDFDFVGRTRHLLFNHPRANIGIPYKTIETYLGKPLQPLTRDILELGVAVYIADLHIMRHKDLGRRINLLMPLRCPDIWTSASTQLEQAVSFLGRDRFKLHAVEHPDSSPKCSNLTESSYGDCICLFSGGLDSTAGAVWALEKGYNPLFISQYGNQKLGGIQKNIIRQFYEIYDREILSMKITKQTITNLKDLSVPNSVLDKLKELLGKRLAGATEIENAMDKLLGSAGVEAYLPVILKYSRELQHIGLFVSKPKNTILNPDEIWRPLGSQLQSVMAQHLRSFLFLCMAAIVALETGIRKIYVFENGPVAINPLFSEARINTRTAHPSFLALFKELIHKVSGVELQIENPFLNRTKGQVAKELVRPKLRRVVSHTDSCWASFKVPLMAKQREINWCRETHDGECVPCIIRKNAICWAGLEEKDATYLTDIFKEYPHLDVPVTEAIADFTRFCSNVTKLEDNELIHFAPDLSITETGEFTLKELLKMYRKHAHEMLHGFRKLGNKKLIDDFKAIL